MNEKKHSKWLAVIWIIISLSLLFFFIYFILFETNLIGRVIDNPPNIHQFYGAISLENGESYNGFVEAKISGISVMNASSVDSRYGFNPLFIVQNTDDGDLIEFFVDGKKAGEYGFSSFGFTELNLVVKSDAPVIPSSGSGGGSGGGGSFDNKDKLEENKTEKNQENKENIIPETAENQEKPEKYKGIAGFAVFDDNVKVWGFGILAIIFLIMMIFFMIRAGRRQEENNL